MTWLLFLKSKSNQCQTVSVSVPTNARRMCLELPPPSKSARQSPGTGRVSSVDALPRCGELLSVAMTQRGQAHLTLKMFVGKSFYIINDGDAQQNLPRGSVVAGFGKGKFKTAEDTTGPSKALRFSLPNSEALVLQGVTLKTVGAMVAARKAADPSAKVAYHEMDSVPEKVGAFKLTTKTPIDFAWADDNGKDQQLSVACFIPQDVYQQVEFTGWVR